ncbi:MAG: N-acetylmuramoyl-L-alanine amidase [Tidjanibacter sp.]|nr:N-acetylmuramoyl-L-alanine amidase [Tidjanibacter sp.]
MKFTTRVLLILTLLLPTLVCAQGKIDSAERRLSTVVIDAGHGGKDPGCTWGKHTEKELNLKVALLLGGMIEDAYNDVTVIYTRSDDRFVELHTRGDIANKANADLFISIHTDAVGNNEAHGSSTYIMGNDKSEKNLAVAQRENSVIVMEGDYEEKYEGYDPSSAESFIIFSLMQYAYSEQSMVFAEMIQKHYKLNTPIVDRGARQGPYLVLWRTAMPAVLTEMGFMTHKGDRDYLHSEVGQKQIAKALFDAFSEYRTRCNAKAEQSGIAKPTEVVQTAAPAPKQEVKPAPTPKQESKPAVKQSSAPMCYVQICTLSKKSDPNDRKFGKWAGKIVQKQTSSGKWRCLIPASSTEEARAIKAEAEKSFAGAYIVKE